MTVEILATTPANHGGLLRAASVDGPAPGEQVDGDAIELDGWVVGAAQPAVAVRVFHGGEMRSRIAVGRERPDVAAALPTHPWAATSGFRGWAPVTGLEGEFAMSLAAELADGTLAPLATMALRVLPEPETAGDDAAGWPGPDFIVIGAQRAGSTSLYRYLAQHPQVVPSTIKELKHFTLHHRRPWGWYRRQWPEDVPAGALLGEATPYYLFHPHAAQRIADRAPQAKLVAVLRNPVDRAHSHYWHEVGRGMEWLPFEEALAAEPGRLAGERERLLADPDAASHAFQTWSYAARGRYADQLRDWLEVTPRHNLLVVRSEDLYRDPEGTVRQATDFLGLPPAPLADRTVHNERRYPRMDPATRERLVEAFRPANRELERLLGMEMGWDGPGQ